ncbi:MAG: hypothetical protein ACREX0_01100, partial [Noviherbaspirillum sp.]
LLSACSPKFDWREVRGGGAPFIVTLPAKPASLTRTINLDGMQVQMTMTAAEVDGVTFAVGAAAMADAAQAQKAIVAMKTALVKNIGGTIKHEKTSPAGTVPTVIEVEVRGASGNGNTPPRLLLARFVAKDQFVYQILVAGEEKSVSREAADTFFTSFKPN